jgi:CheY-like chemotaxis protein
VRVLVVDDDAGNRGLLADVLADDGHEVAQAADGAAALALLPDWQPDVILLDLLMPEMDGWDFLAAYQHRAPVILLTAAAVGPEGTIFGRPLPPVAGVLVKPFPLNDLFAAVRAAGAPR